MPKPSGQCRAQYASASFMLRLILPASVSTDWTRTFTSWPTSSSSSTLSTKPSLIWVMWTSPSAVDLPSAELTVTKAPKAAVRATLPDSHSSGPTSAKGVKSADPRPAPPPPLPDSFMESPILPLSRSTSITRTWISCPTSASSSVFSTKPSLICVMWTRPSTVSPPSGGGTDTKRPKGTTRATVPVSHWSLGTPAKAEKSCGPRRGEAAILLSTIARPSLPSSVTWLTHTSTS
mmetsp:Transcript_4292/g.6594  ORF Transcript_4292/g.6594 Transcript_4292/m.6594 type:complete len:234 (+) Transcript_4292:69-770(+)